MHRTETPMDRPLWALEWHQAAKHRFLRTVAGLLLDRFEQREEERVRDAAATGSAFAYDLHAGPKWHSERACSP